MSGSDAAVWAGAIATFIAVLVALFKDEISRLWRRPKLTAAVRLRAPDCHKTELVIQDQQTGQALARGGCYYFRIWVENKGNLRAEKVQVFAARLWRRHADGSFQEERSFLPMNLRWAHSQGAPGGPEIFAEGISPFMGKHCDLGHISHPQVRGLAGENLKSVPEEKTIFALDLEVAPNTRSHLIPQGVYRLELRIAAANAKPVTKSLELTLTGEWHEDEERMFSDGVGLKELQG